MVVTCVIEFDNNPLGIYFAGQVLTGKISLSASKAKQVQGIKLKISGFAHTSWTERRRKPHNSANHAGSNHRTIHYEGHDDYISSITYLLGSESNQSVVIDPGMHTYTFACHLPQACPSSYEGQYGHVRYLVKVALIRPWKFDQTFTKGFTVLKIMDLNYDSPLLKIAANSEMSNTLGCGPCKTNPLKMQMTLPQSGFVPGQKIPVTVLISNDTKVDIKELKLELVLLASYYSQSPHTAIKTERIVVSKLKGDSVQRHCNKLFNYVLPVTATPPTCLNLCRLVQLSYQLELEAKVKGWYANQVLCLPVTIGNVPLATGAIQQQPTSSNMNMERALTYEPTETSVAPTAAMTKAEESKLDEPYIPWTASDDMPPPSYAVAVHMPSAKITADEAHDYGQSEFAPIYPVFDMPVPSAPQPTDMAEPPNNNATWL